MSETINKMIGSRVKELRESAGLSQDELAHVMGITRVTIGRIERGDNACTIKTIEAFVKIFNVGFRDFFNFDYPTYNKKTQYIPIKNPESKVDIMKENHHLLRENSRLKTLLLQHNISY